MTLSDLINSTCWLNPEQHMTVSIFNKEAYAEDDLENAWVNIDLNVRNIAKYGNYTVGNIDIVTDDDELPKMSLDLRP